MGQASHVHENKEWNLDKTIRQAEQKFSTDLKMIAMETSNNDKLLKTLFCLERKTTVQIPDEYKQNTKNLSTRFRVTFYDDKIVVQRSLRNTVITLLHKEHPSINKMSHAAKLFWWPKMNKEIQQKYDECIPCKMTGQNNKPQLRMTG